MMKFAAVFFWVLRAAAEDWSLSSQDGWPSLFPIVSLAASGADTTQSFSRRAQSRATCNHVNMVQAPAYTNFETCYNTKMATANLSVVGTQMLVQAECWCSNDLKTLIDNAGCCKSRQYKPWCEMECNPDCKSQEALLCLEECPPLCTMPQYAPVNCNCSSCSAYIICISEAHENVTIASVACDSNAFQASAAVANYGQCISSGPVRTNWDRFLSQYWCSCQVGLPAVIATDRCCDTAWAGDVCSQQCLNETECSTTVAKQCLSDCDRLCGQLLPEQVTSKCLRDCLHPGSPCYIYKTCQPDTQTNFGYTCLGGSTPDVHGCCQVSRNGEAASPMCPTLCSTRNEWSLPWGIECECYGCPANQTAGVDILNNFTVLTWQDLAVSAQATIASIVVQTGLSQPTSDTILQMHSLMTARNNAILASISAAKGVYTKQLQASIDNVTATYNDLVLNVASVASECLLRPSSCRTTTTTTAIAGTASVAVTVSGSFQMTVVNSVTFCKGGAVSTQLCASFLGSGGPLAALNSAAKSCAFTCTPGRRLGARELGTTATLAYSVTAQTTSSAAASTLASQASVAVNSATVASLSSLISTATSTQVTVTQVKVNPPVVSSASGTTLSVSSPVDATASFVPIIIAVVVAGAVLIIGGLFAAVYIRRNKATANVSREDDYSSHYTLEPIGGDATVVVGRPIDREGVNPAKGAPVQHGEAKPQGNDKNMIVEHF